jgi:hypothetical protein
MAQATPGFPSKGQPKPTANPGKIESCLKYFFQVVI